MKLGPNIHRTSNYGTGIVFIGNMEGGEGALVTKDWHRIEVKQFTEISVHRDSGVSVRFAIRFDENSIRFGYVIKTLEK